MDENLNQENIPSLSDSGQLVNSDNQAVVAAAGSHNPEVAALNALQQDYSVGGTIYAGLKQSTLGHILAAPVWGVAARMKYGSAYDQPDENYNVYKEPELDTTKVRQGDFGPTTVPLYRLEDFAHVRNRSQFEVTKARIDREREDNRLAAENPRVALATGLLGEVVNPFNLGPAAVGVKVMGQTSRLATAATGAAIGVGSNVASTFVENKLAADSASEKDLFDPMQTTFAAVFGGAVGAMVASRMRKMSVQDRATLSEFVSEAKPEPSLEQRANVGDYAPTTLQKSEILPTLAAEDRAWGRSPEATPGTLGEITVFHGDLNGVSGYHVIDGHKRVDAMAPGPVEVKVLDVSASEAVAIRDGKMLSEGRVTHAELEEKYRANPDYAPPIGTHSDVAKVAAIAKLDKDFVDSARAKNVDTDALAIAATHMQDLSDVGKIQYQAHLNDVFESGKYRRNIAAADIVAERMRNGENIDLDDVRKLASKIDVLAEKMADAGTLPC